jgi:hypothetical protein
VDIPKAVKRGLCSCVIRSLYRRYAYGSPLPRRGQSLHADLTS